MLGDSHGDWYYQQVELGYNYRMTELQGALGVSQMRRVNQFVNVRHQLAERYNKTLAELPVVLPYQNEDSYSGLHLYVIRLKLNAISKTHKQVFDALRQSGIGVNVHYIPVHTQPYFQKFGFVQGDYPNAERYYQEAISLPMFPTMTEEQQNRVVDALATVLKE